MNSTKRVEIIRGKLFEVRAMLRDEIRDSPAVETHAKHIDGLLTCGMIALHDTIAELKRRSTATSMNEPVNEGQDHDRREAGGDHSL